MIIVVMGVSGSGKTTIGEKLATALGWAFYDGDDYHPPTNVEKMSRGIPLTDEDRQAWLLRLRAMIERLQKNGENGIIASSALKAAYRQLLKGDDENIIFVFLKGSYEVILQRMEARQDHFMKADMLRSQFDALEPPNDAIVVEISLAPDEIVNTIIRHLPFRAEGE